MVRQNGAGPKLRSIEDGGIQAWRNWRPWELLLLLQWCIEFGGGSSKAVVPTENLLIRLSNAFHTREFSDPVFADGAPHPVLKTMRIVGYQQFWLQRPLHPIHVLRQLRLFPPGSPQSTYLKEKIGIDGHGIVEAYGELWQWATGPGRASLYLPRAHTLSEPTRCLLAHLELDVYRGHKQVLETPFYIRSRMLQTYQTSPLVFHPILKIEHRRALISRRVLEESFRLVPFFLVRQAGDRAVIDAYADAFEDYVGSLIGHCTDNVISESELRRDMIPTGPCVDFIVPDKDACILLDAKNVHTRAIARVNPDDRVLGRELKKSIIKGIKQGLATAAAILEARPRLLSNVDSRANIYVTVISHGDLYLGSTGEFWSEFVARELADHIDDEYGGCPPVPPQNISVLSVDDLEALTEAVHNGEVAFGEFFARYSAADVDPQGRVFLPRQHLNAGRATVPVTFARSQGGLVSAMESTEHADLFRESRLPWSRWRGDS